MWAGIGRRWRLHLLVWSSFGTRLILAIGIAAVSLISSYGPVQALPLAKLAISCFLQSDYSRPVVPPGQFMLAHLHAGDLGVLNEPSDLMGIVAVPCSIILAVALLGYEVSLSWRIGSLVVQVVLHSVRE